MGWAGCQYWVWWCGCRGDPYGFAGAGSGDGSVGFGGASAEGAGLGECCCWGLLHLLPAAPLDGEKLFRWGGVGTGKMLSFERAVALGLFVLGIAMGSVWFVVISFFVVVAGHVEGQGNMVRNEVGAVTLRDVMLTDYTTLSASDTLEDALERAVHSLQDVFPVVRGGTIVGAVSRQSILEALTSGGNSYVQGIMARTFQVAHPDDALVTTLRRIAGTGGTQFVSVLERERVVGIVTPNHLSHSIRLRSHLAEECSGTRFTMSGEPEGKNQVLAPGLYLVATPIGNLEDITLRALRVLRSVDRIACEDTRQTQKLLNHFGIRTPTVSYHQHNELSRAEELAAELRQGGRIAVVSDAGTPGIADPGGHLAAAAIAAGVSVFPVPGANAALSALIASGLPTLRSLRFMGFCRRNGVSGFRRLKLWNGRGRRTSFMRLRTGFWIRWRTLLRRLGGNKALVVARELTKLHEEFLRGIGGGGSCQAGGAGAGSWGDCASAFA